MVFSGAYRRVVDEKRRVVIPKQIREQLGKPAPKWLHVAPGSFGSLWIFTPDQLQRFGERLLANRHSDAELAAFRLLYAARSEPADLDSHGRLLIPETLAAHAELKTEALLLGVFDHLQLWNPARWEAFEQAHRDQYDATAIRVFNSGL
jgi:MraZ protein